MSYESSTLPRDLLLQLLNWMSDHFDKNELINLCLELSIDYESLGGNSKETKTRELILYCDRHGRIPELAYQVENLRPRLPLPTALKRYIERITSQWLNRSNWLAEHGFIDPFSLNAFRAEDDPLFNLQGLPAFVDLPNFERLKGSLESPDYRYIFGSAGAGKTSLRQRIVDEFDQDLVQGLSNKPRILAVAYVNHDYDISQADTHSHVLRIADLIAGKIKAIFQLDLPFSVEQSSRDILENILASLKSLGLDGVYILIDNLEIETTRSPLTTFDLIRQLVMWIDVLGIQALIFKFLLPIEILDLVRQNLPNEIFYIIKWQKEDLADVLRRRLLACVKRQDPSENKDDKLGGGTALIHSQVYAGHLLSLGTDSAIDGAAFLLSEICSQQVASRIARDLVEFGFRLGRPRDMWRLGYYLLEEHFNRSINSRRSSTDLIEYKSLGYALERFTNDEYTQSFIASTVALPFPHQLERTEQARIANALEKIVVILDSLANAQHPGASWGNTTSVQGDSTEKLILAIDRLSGVLSESQNPDRLRMTDSVISTLKTEEASLKQEISNSIAGDNFDGAFYLLRSSKTYEHQGIIWQRVWVRLTDAFDRGEITREYYYAELNKLASSVLKLLGV